MRVLYDFGAAAMAKEELIQIKRNFYNDLNNNFYNYY